MGPIDEFTIDEWLVLEEFDGRPHLHSLDSQGRQGHAKASQILTARLAGDPLGVAIERVPVDKFEKAFED
jgi:hypothetical protein